MLENGQVSVIQNKVTAYNWKKYNYLKLKSLKNHGFSVFERLYKIITI